MSVRREVIGKKITKTTCSRFAIAVEVAFVTWLGKAVGSSGGSKTSTEEERETTPEETVVVERRLPVGGL